MAELTLGSLFDGIGGWLLAAQRYGIKPVWASEIEPFPIQVTKKHFPDVQHLGDVSKIDATAVPAVDIVTSGSPCQDLSIAGNRAGLCGSRSSLFYDSVRLFRELREASGGRTRWYVWENVVGALSSSGGADFRQVLETLTETSVPMPESGRWANSGVVRSRRCAIAWRVIDAQYWGVAQRRRRLFLIADFGASAERKPEILFEPESLCWHPAPFKTTWQDNSRQSADCSGASSYAIAGNIIDRQDHTGGNGNGFQPDVCYTLNTADRHAVFADGTLTPWDVQSNRIVGLQGIMPSLQAMGNGGGAKGLAIFDHRETFGEGSYGGWTPAIAAASTLKASGGFIGGGSENLVAGANCVNTQKNKSGGAVATFSKVASTLRAGAGAPKHLQDIVGRLVLNDQGGSVMSVDNISATLRAENHGRLPCIVACAGVRKLTPIECERLQGLPDNYTLVDEKSSDSTRYKALGNGMAQPCADFIMAVVKRMAEGK